MTTKSASENFFSNLCLLSDPLILRIQSTSKHLNYLNEASLSIGENSLSPFWPSHSLPLSLRHPESFKMRKSAPFLSRWPKLGGNCSRVLHQDLGEQRASRIPPISSSPPENAHQIQSPEQKEFTIGKSAWRGFYTQTGGRNEIRRLWTQIFERGNKSRSLCEQLVNVPHRWVDLHVKNPH